MQHGSTGMKFIMKTLVLGVLTKIKLILQKTQHLKLNLPSSPNSYQLIMTKKSGIPDPLIGSNYKK